MPGVLVRRLLSSSCRQDGRGSTEKSSGPPSLPDTDPTLKPGEDYSRPLPGGESRHRGLQLGQGEAKCGESAGQDPWNPEGQEICELVAEGEAGLSSAGTQGLLSPQGMGMLSPLSIQKPHSRWGRPIPLTHTWSVSPRVPFLLAHRHAEFQQPQGLCTCGPSAGTPSKFLPRPGSFSYEANRKSKLQSGAPPPRCPSQGWSFGFTWVPGDQIWVWSKKSKRQGRRARDGGGGEWKQVESSPHQAPGP